MLNVQCFSEKEKLLRKVPPRPDAILDSVDGVLCTVALSVTFFLRETAISRMASEVMLAPTAAPGTSRREIDDVRDMVRNAAVTTVYVSCKIPLLLC